MNRHLKFLGALALTFAIAPLAGAQQNPQNPAEMRIKKEVRHELLMLPYIGVFDNLAFQVQGGTVTLIGQVVRPVDKSDAQNAVKGIEGVSQVVNNIQVLPPSQMDDGLRLRLFHAIYGFPSLQRYDLGVIKPIRIIVNSGHVTLEGVVDSEADKNTAGIRANSVSGVFSVTNNLQVVPNT